MSQVAISPFARHHEANGTIVADANERESHQSQLLAAKWAEAEMANMKETREVRVHDLFVGFMYAASKFASADADKEPAESLDEEAALFELCCYFYSAVDLWLVTNKPDFRERISSGFYDEIVNLYSRIFETEKPAIGKIFNQRLIKYAELYRSDFPDMKKTSWTLSQVIMISKRKAKPELYDFEKGPLVVNAAEAFETEMAFLLWVKHIFQVYIENLEQALESIT
jgi:hypothetical protein